MKPALLFACLATGICPALHAEAASAKSLWPTQADKALCDPIFARLAQQERSPQMAQAQSAPKQTAQDGGQEKKPDEGELATQLSAMLQACSYDGKALKIDPKALAASVGAEGAEAVDSIMRFTGLPQNFKIMESDVPNAAAMIVLGRDGIPQRVIAYNRQFMQRVRRATDEDDWSSISIMAHEIGHHLSGHTLVPGGSQPPIELEADTFSGFVLFKMGAALPDAQKAIAALVPEADGPTHPGRKKRLSAVEAGWTESCRQQQDECDDSVTPVAAAAPPAPVRPTPMAQAPAAAAGSAPAVPLPDIPGAGAIAMPKLGKDGAIAGAAIQPAQIDRMPRLDLTATPSKFNRFVYDTVGVFDPAVKEKLSQTAFQFAAATNVEIVTIVADDLQGRPADQYALDAMRRLRVGKLDVGNGAVLV
ncbi:MAG: TPM domain-containing protein, partial [Phyllobacterium sp.]